MKILPRKTLSEGHEVQCDMDVLLPPLEVPITLVASLGVDSGRLAALWWPEGDNSGILICDH